MLDKRDNEMYNQVANSKKKGEIKMKKFLVMLLTLVMGIGCVAFTGCSGNNGKTLNVYTNAGFAPYEYINDKGEVVGVDIDIMKEVGAILGYKVVINDIKFSQILTEVTKSTLAVGAAGMTKKDERDEIALSTISYATSVQYVIVPAGSFSQNDLSDGKLPISSLASLNNKAIGVQEATTGNYLIDDAINGTEDDEGQHVAGDLEGLGCSTVLYTNAIVASQDIGTTLGAVVIDKLPAQTIANASNGALEAIELDAEPESYVIYCNKEATELVEKINAVLTILIDSGVVDYFTLKHSGGIVA